MQTKDLVRQGAVKLSSWLDQEAARFADYKRTEIAALERRVKKKREDTVLEMKAEIQVMKVVTLSTRKHAVSCSREAGAARYRQEHRLLPASLTRASQGCFRRPQAALLAGLRQ